MITMSAKKEPRTRTQRPQKGDAEARILASATGLFARFGFNGVSTREIAARADVSEVTIYRRFPSKRDLYIAALDAELQRVKLGGDHLAGIAEAADARSLMARTFELISDVLLSRSELLRLIQYSALELGEDLDPLLCKYLSQLVEVVAHYLEPWISRGELRCNNAKALVLALVGIIVSQQPLNRLFHNNNPGPESIFSAFKDSMVLVYVRE